MCEKRPLVDRMSVIEDLEQNFGSLTAEITVKTGRIPNLSGSKCEGPLEEPEITSFRLSRSETRTHRAGGKARG